ncbi:MAG: hypothetical protein V1825_01865 [Candidatus Falkowbacteria bacterium]
MNGFKFDFVIFTFSVDNLVNYYHFIGEDRETDKERNYNGYYC